MRLSILLILYIVCDVQWGYLYAAEKIAIIGIEVYYRYLYTWQQEMCLNTLCALKITMLLLLRSIYLYYLYVCVQRVIGADRRRWWMDHPCRCRFGLELNIFTGEKNISTRELFPIIYQSNNNFVRVKHPIPDKLLQSPITAIL